MYQHTAKLLSISLLTFNIFFISRFLLRWLDLNWHHHHHQESLASLQNEDPVPNHLLRLVRKKRKRLLYLPHFWISRGQSVQMHLGRTWEWRTTLIFITGAFIINTVFHFPCFQNYWFYNFREKSLNYAAWVIYCGKLLHARSCQLTDFMLYSRPFLFECPECLGCDEEIKITKVRDSFLWDAAACKVAHLDWSEMFKMWPSSHSVGIACCCLGNNVWF